MRGFVPAQEYDEEVRVLSSREIEITCSLANTFTVLNPPSPKRVVPFSRYPGRRCAASPLRARCMNQDSDFASAAKFLCVTLPTKQFPSDDRAVCIVGFLSACLPRKHI